MAIAQTAVRFGQDIPELSATAWSVLTDWRTKDYFPAKCCDDDSAWRRTFGGTWAALRAASP